MSMFNGNSRCLYSITIVNVYIQWLLLWYSLQPMSIVKGNSHCLYEMSIVFLITSKVCINFDSSTGCEREMFGRLHHNNRVGDALIICIINVEIFRRRRKYKKKAE